MSTQPIALVPKAWNDPPMKSRRERLWLAEGKLCHWCKRPTRLVDEETADQATIDHVIPRGKGGTNEDSNLRSSCRDCNGRRNHEDMLGLAEGYLLGKNWKGFRNGAKPTPNRSKYVVLSGDEKKALMAKMDKVPVRHLSNEDVLREQRDQALKQIAQLQKEVTHWKTVANTLESMTIRGLIRKRIAKWLLDGDRKQC